MQSGDGNGSHGNEPDPGDDKEDSEDSGERALYSLPGSAACDTKAETVG